MFPNQVTALSWKAINVQQPVYIGCLYRDLFYEMRKRNSLKLQELKQKKESNPNAYASTYKDLDVIAYELDDYLTNTVKFMTNINSELRALPSHDVPVLNSKVAYNDDDRTNVGVSDIVPFKNPKKQELTQDQKDLVEQFLSVFFDAENLSIFSWMMGTVFMNKPIHDENISRFFLLYSQAGGVGKSTIMKLITEGLLPSSYAILLPEFDTYFLAGDRFRSSNLSQKRLVVYDEAVFNGPLDKENMHNFHGLNEDTIKTFATTGRLLLEKKFQSPKLAQFDNIHVILTNFLPVVPENRPDLGRRFLPCMLRPTKMQDKARELNNMTVAQMIDYVRKNGQAFINYFAHVYITDPYKYATYVYSHEETESEEQTAINENAKETAKYHEYLKSLGAFKMLKQLGSDLNADANSLIMDCKKAIPSDEYILNSKRTDVLYTNSHNKDIHFSVNKKTHKQYVYVNSAKRTFVNYKNGLAIRDVLLRIARCVKKFTQYVFELPLSGSNLSVSNSTRESTIDNVSDVGAKSKTTTTNLDVLSLDCNLVATNNTKSDTVPTANSRISRCDEDVNGSSDHAITQQTKDSKISSDTGDKYECKVTTHQLHKLDNTSKDTIAISDVHEKGIIDVFNIIQKRTTIDVSHVLNDIKRYSPTMQSLNATPVYVNKQTDTFMYAKNNGRINIYIDIAKLQKRYGYDIYQALNAFSEKATFNDIYCFKYHI